MMGVLKIDAVDIIKSEIDLPALRNGMKYRSRTGQSEPITNVGRHGTRTRGIAHRRAKGYDPFEEAAARRIERIERALALGIEPPEKPWWEV